MADNQYYLALLYKKLGRKEEYRNAMLEAQDLYLKGIHQFDPYTHQVDEVYLSDIQTELESLN